MELICESYKADIRFRKQYIPLICFFKIERQDFFDLLIASFLY